MAIPYSQLGIFDPSTKTESELDSFLNSLVQQDSAYKTSLQTNPTHRLPKPGQLGSGVIPGTEKLLGLPSPVGSGTVQAGVLAAKDQWGNWDYQQKVDRINSLAEDLQKRNQPGPLSFLNDAQFAIPAILGAGLTLGFSGAGAASGGAGAGVGTGGAFSGPVAGSSVGSLSGSGLMGSLGGISSAGTGLGTAVTGGSNLFSSILGSLGGGNVSPMGTVLSEVLKKVPGLVDNFFAGKQADENTDFLQSLMQRNSPENLLKAFEGSSAYKDFDKILNNPESLTLFNSIMERSTRQANRESAKSGTLSPGTGELSGAHADLLTKLIFENAGGYHTDILNSLPLNQSAGLISNSLAPQLGIAGGLIQQRNAASEFNPLRTVFGGAGNQLFDKIASLFS